MHHDDIKLTSGAVLLAALLLAATDTKANDSLETFAANTTVGNADYTLEKEPAPNSIS